MKDKFKLGDIVQVHQKSFAGKTEGMGNFLGTVCEIDHGYDVPDTRIWRPMYKVFLEDNDFIWVNERDITNVNDVQQDEKKV